MNELRDFNFKDPLKFHVLLVEDEQVYADGLSQVLQSRVAAVLAEHGIQPERIDWTAADNLTEALQILDAANRAEPPGHGFDLVLSDIKIKSNAGEPVSEGKYEYGLELARAVIRYNWPGALVGLTQYADRDDLVDLKTEMFHGTGAELHARAAFDDFLFKQEILGKEGLALAKLRRVLVPLGRYVSLAKRWDPPGVFASPLMQRILRDLVLISRAPIAKLPHRILFMGEPGSGKTHLARGYDELLRQYDKDQQLVEWMRKKEILAKIKQSIEPRKPAESPRPPIQQVNCAGLVPEGEGGRLVLFGHGPREGFQGSPVPGVFEKATYYGEDNERDENGLAQASGGRAPKPNVERAGVVFLDEFGELAPELQAAILKTVDEGIVIRQDGSMVPVACHVIFATNADVPGTLGTGEELASASKRMRADLIDRVPYVIQVPPLRERTDEIESLILGIAAARLKAMEGGIGEEGITISRSALQLIRRAVALGIIQSIRQLQMIASIGPGETTITDSNVAWVLRKAQILGLAASITTEDAAVIPLAEKINALRLPAELADEDLPVITRVAIDTLFARLRGDAPIVRADEAFPPTSEGIEALHRFHLLSKLLPNHIVPKLYGNEGSEALRAARSRAVKHFGLTLTRNKAKDAEIIAKYLLSPGTGSETQAVEAVSSS